MRVTSEVSGALGGLKTVDSALGRTGARISKTGSFLSRTLTPAVLVAGAVATKMSLDYEQAFTKISAISNASAEDVARWKEEVKGLAEATGRDPQELAEALFFLASAGLKTDEVMSTLEATAKASAVGLGDMTAIAKLTANVLNAYAKSGITATQATDTLVAAVKAGTAEPEEFAGAMGRILPIASRAGVGFDQLAASLAALSNVGLDVNEGATAMRGLLQALIAPTDMAREAMKKLGLSAQDLLDAFQEDGILGALTLLEERAGKAADTEAEMFDIMRRVVPNIRALTGELALTGENADSVRKIFDQVTNSTGALGDAMKKTREDPAFKLQQGLAKLKVAAIELGNKLLPIAEKIVGVVSDLAEGFSNLSPAMQNNIVKWGLLAAAAGPFLRILGGIVGIAAKVIAALKGIGAAAGVAGAATAGAGLLAGPGGNLAAGAAGAGAAGAAGGTSLLAKALAALTTPVGIVATGFAALVLSLKKWGDEANAAEHRTNLLTQALLAGKVSIEEVRDRFGDVPDAILDVEKAFTTAKGTAHAYFNTTVEDARRHSVFIDKDTQATIRNLIETGNFAGAAAVLKGALEDLPKKVQTEILMPGLSSANAGVDNLVDSLAALPASKTIRINILKEGIVEAQHGFHGMATRPTLFLAGEAGPERVDITPGGRGRRGTGAAAAGGGKKVVINQYYLTVNPERSSYEAGDAMVDFRRMELLRGD